MEDNFLEIAKEAALEAGKVIKKYLGKDIKNEVKDGDKSNFATKADLESEQKIIQILTKNFPDHNIIAEESGGKKGESEYTWLIDPLDGTYTFKQNIPYFGVSIGLLKDGEPIVGVINHVSFETLYWAQKGKGAFKNGEKISVSKRSDLTEAAGRLDAGHRQKRQAKIDLYISKMMTKIGMPYEFGSAAISAVMVACGDLDLMVGQAFPWDYAAGTVLIREAGGMVTDFAGNPPDWSKARVEVVFSNGLLHKDILEVLN